MVIRARESRGVSVCRAGTPSAFLVILAVLLLGPALVSCDMLIPIEPPPAGGGGDDGDNFSAAPVADFTYSPMLAGEGQVISFDGSLSWDPEGAVVQHSWTYGDGGQGQGSRTFHSYASDGTYVVRLEVRDAQGLGAFASRPVAIVPAFGWFDVPVLQLSRVAYASSDPSEEFVTILCLRDGNLQGCSVKSSTGRIYYFSASLELRAGQAITLHSGRGTDSGFTFYWQQPAEVWANESGRAELWATEEVGPVLLDYFEYGRF